MRMKIYLEWFLRPIESMEESTIVKKQNNTKKRPSRFHSLPLFAFIIVIVEIVDYQRLSLIDDFFLQGFDDDKNG